MGQDALDQNGKRPWPLEIRYIRDSKNLEIDFDDNSKALLSAEFLRINSPSAEVKGHGPGQEILVTGVQNVGIAAMEPVGNYAIRIRFDDGHETGIYSWAYFYELNRDKDSLWADHLQKLATAGESR